MSSIASRRSHSGQSGSGSGDTLEEDSVYGASGKFCKESMEGELAEEAGSTQFVGGFEGQG